MNMQTDIEKYIIDAVKAGMSESEIIAQLRSTGWQDQDIFQVLGMSMKIRKKKSFVDSPVFFFILLLLMMAGFLFYFDTIIVPIICVVILVMFIIARRRQRIKQQSNNVIVSSLYYPLPILIVGVILLYVMALSEGGLAAVGASILIVFLTVACVIMYVAILASKTKISSTGKPLGWKFATAIIIILIVVIFLAFRWVFR